LAANRLGRAATQQALPGNPAPTTDDGNTGILVQGTGEVRAQPDIARLSLGVQTQAKDAGEAARDNAARTTPRDRGRAAGRRGRARHSNGELQHLSAVRLAPPARSARQPAGAPATSRS
jgi:hypothetical protein